LTIKPIDIDTPVSLQEGYDMLTPQNFSVWIRLMVATEKERTGYGKLARTLGFSRIYTMKIIKELKSGGFVKTKKLKKGNKILVEIRKRIILSGKNSFIRLT